MKDFLIIPIALVLTLLFSIVGAFLACLFAIAVWFILVGGVVVELPKVFIRCCTSKD